MYKFRALLMELDQCIYFMIYYSLPSQNPSNRNISGSCRTKIRSCNQSHRLVFFENANCKNGKNNLFSRSLRGLQQEFSIKVISLFSAICGDRPRIHINI